MAAEKFKEIPGYGGYSVTSWGRVWSEGAQDFLIPQTTEKGYLRVTLSHNGETKRFRVHRLVGEAFLPNPEGKPQIHHKDGNKKNNSVSNLEWVTNEENQRFKETEDRIDGEYEPQFQDEFEQEVRGCFFCMNGYRVDGEFYCQEYEDMKLTEEAVRMMRCGEFEFFPERMEERRGHNC